MSQIEACLCPAGADAVEISRIDPAGAEVSGASIEVRLERPGACDAGGRWIEASLVAEDGPDNPYCGLETGLTWARAAADPEDEADQHLQDSVLVRLRNPDHCHWRRSLLCAEGASDGRRWLGVEVSPVVDFGASCEDIPEWSEVVIGTNLIAPGERLVQLWEFDDGGRTWLVPGGSDWWGTCCLTGGRVVEVLGDAAEPDAVYRVEVMGWTVRARRTDFTAYEPGAWVFLFRPSETCADCHRTLRCKSGCAEIRPEDLDDPDKFTILPVMVAEFGRENEFASHARRYLATELGRLFRACVQVAQVIDVDYEADRADVEAARLLPGSLPPDQGEWSGQAGTYREDAVPVHYRCSDAVDATGGARAFSPDDLVYVLRDAGGIHVVGHERSLRACDSVVLCFLVERPDWHLRMDPTISNFQAHDFDDIYVRLYARLDRGTRRLVWISEAEAGQTHCLRTVWSEGLVRRWWSFYQDPGDGCGFVGHLATDAGIVMVRHQAIFRLPDGRGCSVVKTPAGFVLWTSRHSTLLQLNPRTWRERADGEWVPPETVRYYTSDALPAWWCAAFPDDQAPHLWGAEGHDAGDPTRERSAVIEFDGTRFIYGGTELEVRTYWPFDGLPDPANGYGATHFYLARYTYSPDPEPTKFHSWLWSYNPITNDPGEDWILTHYARYPIADLLQEGAELEFDVQTHADQVGEGYWLCTTTNDPASPAAIVEDEEEVCRVGGEARQRTCAPARQGVCLLRVLDAGGGKFEIVFGGGTNVSDELSGIESICRDPLWPPCPTPDALTTQWVSVLVGPDGFESGQVQAGGAAEIAAHCEGETVLLSEDFADCPDGTWPWDQIDWPYPWPLDPADYHRALMVDLISGAKFDALMRV